MNTEEAIHELRSQTAKISWQELERFFAAGKLVYVDESLDMITVGTALIQDRKAEFQQWTEQGLVHPVNDKQATSWAQHNPTLWACVVSPWVLVQNNKPVTSH